MENPIEVLGGALVMFAGITAIVLWSRRGVNKAWTGVITKVTKETDEDGDREYVIKYRTDEGKRGKLRISENYYKENQSGFHVNARIMKRKGAYVPELINGPHDNRWGVNII